MREAVIVSTARTGLAKSWRGALNMTHGATMGGHVVRAAIERAGIEPGEVEDVLMGCAMPEGAQGLNPARLFAVDTRGSRLATFGVEGLVVTRIDLDDGGVREHLARGDVAPTGDAVAGLPQLPDDGHLPATADLVHAGGTPPGVDPDGRLEVEQVGGAACHTGHQTCFYRELGGGEVKIVAPRVFDPGEVYPDKPNGGPSTA